MKTKAERREWILNHFKDKVSYLGSNYSTNVLDSDFVCEFADDNQVKVGMQFVGAPKCPRLGKDLAELFLDGFLTRQTCGIGDGLSGMGFPKWVWEYKLKIKA